VQSAQIHLNPPDSEPNQPPLKATVTNSNIARREHLREIRREIAPDPAFPPAVAPPPDCIV
jgi:hypothetical protein